MSTLVYSAWKPGNAGGGQSETILGQWFARSGKRDKAVLATKVGMALGDGKKGLVCNYIIQAAEASLKRLQTDQSHTDHQTVPPKVLDLRFQGLSPCTAKPSKTPRSGARPA